MNVHKEFGFIENRKGLGLFYQLNESQPGSTLVVLCGPLLEEKIFCHPQLTAWSEFLSAEGFSVLNFDYEGTGNSWGDGPGAIENNISDAIDVINWYMTEKQPKPVFLLGIRYGINIAVNVAQQLDQVKGVFGLEPLFNLDQYLQAYMRFNLTTQLSVYGRVREDRKRLQQCLDGGEKINIAGYDVGSDFCESLLKYDLTNVPNDVAIKTMLAFTVVNIAKPIPDKLIAPIEELGYHYIKIVTQPFWAEPKYFSPIQEEAFSASLQFIHRNQR